MQREIETNFAKICEDILDFCLWRIKGLVPQDVSFLSFYHWLSANRLSSPRMGEYHRCLAEFAIADICKDSAEKSLEVYKAAFDHCRYQTPSTYPIRLGLVLNFYLLL